MGIEVFLSGIRDGVYMLGGHMTLILGYMALIPPFFLDCVVAIGFLAGDGSKQWTASGFLYGDFVKKATETESSYRTYLVTNRHVFEGKTRAYLRFNPEGDEQAREYEIPLVQQDRTLVWFAHSDPQIDVAVIPINVNLLKRDRIRYNFFQSDTHIADRAKARELGITEGDGIYTLGFPMELVGGERNFVIVRGGVIARIRDTLAGSSKEFLVDAFVFPGNSGGPVIIKPDFMAIEGTKSLNAAYLIGIVRGYRTYREVAISSQTNRPRITFEENSGLASVFPIDYVIETIKE